MRKLKLGDIVIIRATFLGEPENALAYVYEEYNLMGEGVSIITQNGCDLGGFSEEEQERYLDFIRKSGFEYTFENVIKLGRDFKSQIKPLF